MNALNLALHFHEAYERLAPTFGYETRDDTKAFDPRSKNGQLMIAVCDELLSRVETLHEPGCMEPFCCEPQISIGEANEEA